MSVAILDVGQAAVVLSGAVLALTDGLFEVGVAGLVLGVHGQVVNPLAAINGGHRQGNQEGVAGRSHIFGNSGFHHQIKPLLHIRSGSVASGIRLGHSHAAVLDSNFQSVLHVRGIGSQCSGQFVVQNIAGEVVDSIFGLMSIGSGQADGGQHSIGAVTAVEAIQHAHLTLTVHHLVVHGNIGNAEVGELHALDGILAQLVDNRVIVQAGGDVGFSIPYAIFAGFGNVIFIDTQGCFLAGVNGRLGKCRSHQAEGHERRHQQRQNAMDLFHVQLISFVMLDFLQK